ncbi:Basic protein [Desulfosporosinus metallidurans]|uniref:Basic protein n=2 Tax=Desulfosporosinus metallidurans TaxID=1888891 RepID=A0A1Q8QWN4_9FIRM|nr:Basic protein [Desulfosporosinus metallidurans]
MYLYKIRTDGTGKTKLNSDQSYDINVVGDWIYYSNVSDNMYLYKIRTDGTGETKLNNDKSQSISVVGDWIYYFTKPSNTSGIHYKIRTDGTENQQVK